MREDGLPGGGAQVPGEDLAQDVLQVPGLRHDALHEELQGIREAAVLRGPCAEGQGHRSGGHAGE